MKYLLDTANLEEIRHYNEYFPIAGVTSNPTILKAEGKIDFYDHFKAIRSIIGIDKSLHIQVIAEDYKGIMEESEAILKNVDSKIFIKIPVTEQGIKAIKDLKAREVNVTATAIYTKIQGFLAMEAGADYIAPYFNRMENMDIDPREVISSFSKMIDKYKYPTQIVAASFKNMGQINDAFKCGAQAVTLQSAILREALNMPAIKKAVENFKKDWEEVFGEGVLITDL